MTRRIKPTMYFLGLIIIALVSLMVDFSGVFQAQLLRTPERLETVKLIRQQTDPIQYDLYYQGVREDDPKDITLYLINALVQVGDRYQSRVDVVDQVLLNSGQYNLTTGSNQQVIQIRDLQPQSSSKLGTLVTKMSRLELVSLEYDYQIGSERKTLIDRPVPTGFPQGYQTFQNPTNELMYVRTPEAHTVLGFGERFYSRSAETPLGALIMSDTLTTFQEIESLNRGDHMSQQQVISAPTLQVEQGQIIVPPLAREDLNLLVIRYRSQHSDWSYSPFLLSASADITLPVAVSDLLDFYQEVEYSFGHLSNAFHTTDLDFPYDTLLPGEELPIFFRSAYQSLLPELTRDRQSLEFVLQVNVSPSSDGIYLGFLARDPVTSLDQAVSLLRQKRPVVIFDQASRRFHTRVHQADDLPDFLLIGQQDQVWSHPTTDRNISLISSRFQHIPIPADDALDEIDIVDQSAGDQLLCFFKGLEAEYSLATTATDFASNGDCLAAAERAGLREGRIYPVVYRAQSRQLQGLQPFSIDRQSAVRAPQVSLYDPYEGTFSLRQQIQNEDIRLLSSPHSDFRSFATLVPERLQANRYTIPALPGCENQCYLKVARLHSAEGQVPVATLSRTLLYGASKSPEIQVCFSNQAQIDTLYDPGELDFSLKNPNGPSATFRYQESSDCYVLSLGDEESNGTESNQEPSVRSLSEFVIDSSSLPPQTLVIQSNGLENNHITIPPQRHYLSLDDGSEQQFLGSELIYEHYQLQIQDERVPDPQRKTSYQASSLGDQAELTVRNRGNILLHRFGDFPKVLEQFPLQSPINETILYPGGRSSLAIPNTIRFLPSEEVLIQGFDDTSKTIRLDLPFPRHSQVKIFFENLFRPEVQMEQLVSDGIVFDPQSGYLELENLSGTITLPLQISISRPTDTERYTQTFPETPVPSDIDLASFLVELSLHQQTPSDIPDTTLLEPLLLDRAQAGFPYEINLDLGGIEDSLSYEIQSSRFLNQACSEALSFDPEERRLSGTIPVSSSLESCSFELSLRYLIQRPYAQMEINTQRHYQIPVINPQEIVIPEPERVQVPIRQGAADINQVVVIRDPVESLQESNEAYQDVGTDAGLISSIGDLAVVFDPVQQQLVISGDSSEVTGKVSRYFRAIDQQTGLLRRFQLEFIPVADHEIIVPLVVGFPNRIDVPVVLEGLNFSEQELQSLRILTDSLPADASVSEQQVVTLFGMPELNDQVLPILIDRAITTPSAFEAFELRLDEGESSAHAEPLTVKIDLRFQTEEAEEIRLQPISFKTGTRVVLDLRQFLPNSTKIETGQLPAFLSRNGNQIVGTTPAEATQIDLLIQDYTFVRNIIVPLDIRPEPVEEEPTTPPTEEDEPEETPSEEDSAAGGDLRGAGVGYCFPDIFDQPYEYQQAICIAQEFGIISGSAGVFKPNDPINRAEVSKILVSGPLVLFDILARSEISQLRLAFPESSFRDVSMRSWYFGFVETVQEIGIVDGHPDGTFRPGDQLNHAEAAKLIVNTLRQLQPEAFTAEESLSKNTLPGDPWFAPYVRILNLNGGDLPEPDETSLLTLPISRAQFLYNLMILLDSKSSILTSLITEDD